MYLSKPEEGFCVPVLYVNKANLDINNLNSIEPVNENKEIESIKLTDINMNLTRNGEVESEKKSSETVSNRLVFDDDDCGEEIDPLSHIRKIKELDADNIGKLILDLEDEEIEKDKKEN